MAIAGLTNRRCGAWQIYRRFHGGCASIVAIEPGNQRPEIRNWPFGVDQSRKLRILKYIHKRPSFLVHIGHGADESHAVAVIGIVLSVERTKRLNRFAVFLVPAINRHPPRVCAQAIRDHQVLLLAGDQ